MERLRVAAEARRVEADAGSEGEPRQPAQPGGHGRAELGRAQPRIGDERDREQERPAEAAETIRRLRELDPALTVTKFRERYPGRDSPQAERFASALRAAGLPA